MLSYQEVKTWLEENKQKIVLAVCFVLVFIIGFGAGRFDRELMSRRVLYGNQNNYTTKSANITTKTAEEGTVKAPTPVKALVEDSPQVLGATADKSCPIKGNTASKIYHIPGGTFYNTLKSPKCFKTEAEAQAEGYRKSGR